MKLFELLKGKKVMVETDMKVMVEMEIKEVIEKKHSEELEPSTRENDWWPKSREWVTYTAKFTNGVSKTYNSIDDINFH